MEDIYLVAGLGNPGKEYASTRHNAGFMVLDRLAARRGVRWQSEGRFAASLAKADVAGKRVVFCQPQTFMNSSGRAVAAVTQFYKIPASRVLVVVDDADLPLGTLRLRPSGSPGGHHGLESVQEHLGTQEFARAKVGIGRTAGGGRDIHGHVLGSFAPAERETLESVLERAANQAECWWTEGVQQAMNKFNGVAEPLQS